VRLPHTVEPLGGNVSNDATGRARLAGLAGLAGADGWRSKADSGSVLHATLFSMPTEHILTLLIAERDKLNKAIEALSSPIKRRGRPPKNTAATTAPAPATKKRTFTAAQRRQQAARMKAYWAAKKKAGAKS
jgi:hypothetical protein